MSQYSAMPLRWISEQHSTRRASCAVTSIGQNNAEIWKELLAIVFTCERFNQYMYAKHTLIESDHKPLETITKKPIHSAPIETPTHVATSTEV